MHRGLGIPEVVELICGMAEFPTLAAFARTCQAFQPPALSVLWRDQSDMLHLLQCMPSDLWEVVEERLRFRRAVCPSDWARVLFYAVYVKSFIQTDRAGEVYAAINLTLPKFPLFPNLRHLTWRPRDDVTFPSIRIIAGDKLRSLTVCVDGSEPFRASLLPFLTTFHPKLTHVEFDLILTDSPMTEVAIHSAICSWNYLEKLKFGALNLASMLHLARLPNLKCLELSYFPSDSATIKVFRDKVATTGPVFTALREISGSHASAKDVALFLDVIDPDALERVELAIPPPPVIEDWQTLIAVLARKSSKTLTKLSIREHAAYEHDIPDALERMLTTESVQSLLSFPNLVEVVIVAGHGIELDDVFLKQLASACPRLRKIDLSPGCQSARYMPQITLRGLIPLAQHCPDLNSLTIVLNGLDVDPHMVDKPGGGIVNTSLVHLDVVESPLLSPGAVASFLSAIFPNLERIVTRDEALRNPMIPDWDDSIFGWTMASALVKIISCARSQERRLSNIKAG
ncbi:hypothetical protein B0H15DRAFT_248038 [Mycena belliarum]|uniref:F-box domain-containing protein n=1 Tax=Mycena belliarum TaxID=1033014 RepID=A0AAD6XT20_9AGAR|nr:hypothetical protein B0H15DRAFT_248038 [Mycena belliae]